jgi:hypothetical protein
MDNCSGDGDNAEEKGGKGKKNGSRRTLPKTAGHVFG